MTTANGSQAPASDAAALQPRAARIGWVAGLLWLVGCGSARLMPLQPTRDNEAVAIGSGLEVRADARTHPASVPSSFTPVRISVHNTGATPVYVNLDDIDLAGPDRALDAVPPGMIPVRPHIASLGMDPASPFIVLQRTGGSDSEVRVGRTESVLLEPRLGGLRDWSSTRDRARHEISSSAFQGGAIGAGETREGFVYFRNLPKDAELLTLRVGVRPSPESAPASVVEIRYAVRS